MDKPYVRTVDINGQEFYIYVDKQSDIWHYSVYRKENMALFKCDIVIGNYTIDEAFEKIIIDIKESLEY